MDEGIKHDQGKARLDLVPPEAVFAIGRVLTHGVAKYGERNWEKGMAWGRWIGAAQRHLMAWMAGEEIDRDSGLNHLDQVLTNVAILVAHRDRGIGTDDRARPYLDAGASNIEPDEALELRPLDPVEVNRILDEIVAGKLPTLFQRVCAGNRPDDRNDEILRQLNEDIKAGRIVAVPFGAQGEGTR